MFWLCSSHLQFFELDVYNSDGSPLSSEQLFIQLEKIWNTSLQTNKEPIGILTTNHRNSWAKAYNNLLKGLWSPGPAKAPQQHPQLCSAQFFPLGTCAGRIWELCTSEGWFGLLQSGAALGVEGSQGELRLLELESWSWLLCKWGGL